MADVDPTGRRRPATVLAIVTVLVVVGVVVAAVLVTRAGDDTTATSAGTSSLGDDATATTLEPAALGLVGAACAGALHTTVAGTVTSQELDEASGIVASPDHAGIWWTHNDSGDTARFFAVREDGSLAATFHLPGVTATDIEDIAVGPGSDPGRPERPDVFLADVGDNNRQRSEVVIHRVHEPDPTGTTDGSADGEVALRYRYPDGAHDAEALLVDPDSGALVIVTKDWSLAGRSEIYRADGLATPADPSVVTTLDHVGTVTLPLATLVTGADIAHDGSAVALRSYDGVRLYPRPAGEPLWAAFASEPCTVTIPDEKQGEAVGFAPDGRSFMTLSEGVGPVLHRTTG